MESRRIGRLDFIFFVRLFMNLHRGGLLSLTPCLSLASFLSLGLAVFEKTLLKRLHKAALLHHSSLSLLLLLLFLRSFDYEKKNNNKSFAYI